MKIQIFLCVTLCYMQCAGFLSSLPSRQSPAISSVSPSSASMFLIPPGECECVNETKLENAIISTGEHIIVESVGRIHEFCFEVDSMDKDIKEIKNTIDEIHKKLCKLTDDGDDTDVPWREIENLLYADCVETAIWSLDRWFRNKEWRKMPMCVRKVLIALSCKMGFTELRKLRVMKRLLEKGKWEDAANKVLETEWAMNNIEVAKEITDKLKSVPQQVSK